MTVEELQAAINDLAKRVEEKGFALPGAYSMIRANGSEGVALQAKDDKYEHIQSSIYHAKGDTLAEKLADAAAWIEAQPDPDTRHLHDFMSALGRVIDNGRALGIDVPYLSPLEATMKALSENILTDQRGKK
jgi:hypothetical protein